MTGRTSRFWSIWNMSFGFLGIQFGWALQMANMSAIYEYLGAKPEDIPMLWLAAPLTGLLVQPIIGHMSDRTWNSLGRRKPYFLVGAILSTLALIAMPNSSSLWMAAGLLWILDASINISMEPFRAFVADMLPEEQCSRGFAMQSVFIGAGSVVASALPWMLTNWFHLAGGVRAAGTIPMAVKLSFYLGAAAFFGCVLYTILTTKEYPPSSLDELKEAKKDNAVTEILAAIKAMPETMKQLAVVQIFTWFGLFCMWLYLPVAVAHNVFGAADEKSPLYQQGIEWAGICLSAYSGVALVFSFLLTRLAESFGKKLTHMLCLLCGAAGLLSVAVIHHPIWLLLSMAGVGIAWASIVSMPYAMLAGALPQAKVGVYMGIFNFFITLPEICAALLFGRVMEHYLDNNRMSAVIAGGCFMIVAALLVLRVNEASGRNTKPSVAAALQSAH